jgi:hypothetical protein
MFRRTTVILPAAEARWEVWHCGNGSGSVWHALVEDPVQAANGNGSVVMALPARSCRTFAFSAPTEDRQLLRKLAFVQVEKRGLTNTGAEQTPFDYHVIEQRDGRSLISVDVLTPDAASSQVLSKARAIVASARLFPMPKGKLVIVAEQGKLVLCASSGGRLLHSQIISATRDFNGHMAPEIRIASLALHQQGVVQEVSGIQLWGDFEEEEANRLSEELGLPVEAIARPPPGSAAVQREASTQLLPLEARQALRRRHLLGLRWVAAAIVLLPLLWWVYGERRKLARLEAEAAHIEETLNVPGASSKEADQNRLREEHEVVTAVQARWSSLRNALEPRRYPVAILDGLARCLSAADVVLTRFESKAADISISGTALSAMDAYNYFNAVNKESALGVYSWSMIQPTIGADGSASFEIKGKMR